MKTNKYLEPIHEKAIFSLESFGFKVEPIETKGRLSTELYPSVTPMKKGKTFHGFIVTNKEVPTFSRKCYADEIIDLKDTLYWYTREVVFQENMRDNPRNGW